MNSSADRSSSIFATPSAGRRILHKFTSPFGQKTRSISEFTVKAFDPHKQYSPGETVKGAVTVKVVKPIRLTHISVCLHGFVQVHKTPGSPAESVRGYSSRIGRAQGKKSGEYFGNGFASLFEDESVLCGEGRLAEGSYRFDFEVTFPKDIDLPSSIEFERGTISYMVTATLTRPTTMNPTISHDQRLFLCERIDIASLLPPKPRTITLEPVSRRSRPRGQSKRVAPDSQGRTGTSSVSARTQESAPSSPTKVIAAQDPPRTPSISEVSADSRVSSSVGRTSASGSGYQSQRTSDSLSGLSGATSTLDRTITATVESLKGGCLRGDTIPVRIMVNHTKHIKSMNGVIITLYRLARVDLHPALPLGPMADGQKRKYEDYYPKSLTGLGGLSLSGTGTSHVFRKDLAQTLAPMIVDPQTLKADINARVTVPDDAFPTINTVPGSMISFRYYIEVVLDIQGKLSGSDKYFSQRTGTSAFGTLDMNGLASGGPSSQLLLEGPGVLDTAPIRRDKSVVTSVFEVVVGTMDSERKKGKARAQALPEDENIIDTSHLIQAVTPSHAAPQSHPAPQNQPGQQHYVEPDHQPGWYEWYQNEDASWQNYPEGYGHGEYDEYYNYENGDAHHYEDHGQSSVFIPPPPVESEEGLSEKERLRRAEARLMPSQPPDTAQNPEDLSSDVAGPSAPILPLEPGSDFDNVIARPTQPYSNHSLADASTRADVTPNGSGSCRRLERRTLQEAEQLEPVFANDDKQEMQRRQLRLAASAPPNTTEDDESHAGLSAPAIEADAVQSFEVPGTERQENDGEHLPRYFR